MYGMIHVVQYKWLQEYLGILHNYYWYASNKITQEQDLLLDSMHEIVDYRQRRMHSHRRSCGGNFRKMVEYTDGKPFISKINAIRHPIVYLYRSRQRNDKCRFDMNEVTYQREFNYCFNCGTRTASIDISKDEGHCCLSFKTAEAAGAIDVINDSHDIKFLMNLMPIYHNIQLL